MKTGCDRRSAARPAARRERCRENPCGRGVQRPVGKPHGWDSRRARSRVFSGGSGGGVGRRCACRGPLADGLGLPDPARGVLAGGDGRADDARVDGGLASRQQDVDRSARLVGHRGDRLLAALAHHRAAVLGRHALPRSGACSSLCERGRRPMRKRDGCSGWAPWCHADRRAGVARAQRAPVTWPGMSRWPPPRRRCTAQAPARSRRHRPRGRRQALPPAWPCASRQARSASSSARFAEASRAIATAPTAAPSGPTTMPKLMST